MPENGKLLQQTALFGRLSDQALIFVAENSEERNLRFSEVLYKEGDKHNQDWLGLVIAGQLTQHIHEPMDRETGDPLPILEPGMLFGELSALSVTQVRHSTVAAEVDSKVLVIRSETIWEAKTTPFCWAIFASCDIPPPGCP
eukprot:g1323.t1